MKVYFDTGIFLYLVNPSSIHHMECKDLLKFCQEKGIEIATSVETVQEVITYSKNTKQLEFGIDVAQFVIEVVDQVIYFDNEVLKLFLKNAENYLSPTSRDLIHLSFCQAHGIRNLISYDPDLNKFKAVINLSPMAFMKQYK